MASPGGGRWDPLSNSDHSLRPRGPRERDEITITKDGAELSQMTKYFHTLIVVLGLRADTARPIRWNDFNRLHLMKFFRAGGAVMAQNDNKNLNHWNCLS